MALNLPAKILLKEKKWVRSLRLMPLSQRKIRQHMAHLRAQLQLPHQKGGDWYMLVVLLKGTRMLRVPLLLAIKLKKSNMWGYTAPISYSPHWGK